MFKLVVLSCLIAVAFAKPGGLHLSPVLSKTVHIQSEVPVVKTALFSEPAHVAVHEQTLAKVGEYVESIPTAVSHQSSTIVHNKANIVTPLIAPSIRTSYAPAIKTYAAPVIEHQPIIKTYAAAPVIKSYAAPAYAYAGPAPLAAAGWAAPSLYNYGYASAPLLRSW